jgi:M6 family metalloprotease-like protein
MEKKEIGMKQFWGLGLATWVALLCLFGSVQRVWAAPAAPLVFELTQPDGTSFWAQQWGDEWSNGLETVEGYTIVLDEQTGYWVYAALDEAGQLSTMQADGRVLVVGKDAPDGLLPAVRPMVEKPQTWAQPSAIVDQRNSGSHKTLVLLASFSDRAGTYTEADFASSLFGASNSVQHYYLQASFNQLTFAPAAETYGTANNGVVGWLNLGYNHPNPGSNTDDRNRLIVRNALIAADPYVNFASFDADGNGKLTINELHIVVVVAGYERSYYNTSPSIWAHRWALFNTEPPTLDGKVVGSYADGGGYAQFGEIHYAPGYDTAHQATIGIMAHELGHDITWPDLYDTNAANGTSDGVGIWSLMGAGNWNTVSGAFPGAYPALPDAFLKWYQGWILPTSVNGSLTNATIPQAETNARAYLLRRNPGGVDWDFGLHSGTGEYFLVENRQLTGYDAGLPGCGLFIWHVDESVRSDNYANADETHPLVKLMQADGLDELLNGDDNERGDAGDPYPGTAVNRTFNASSTPNSNLYGGAASGVSVTNISNCSATMTADLTAPSYAENLLFLPMLLRMQATVSNPVRNGTFEAGRDGSWSEYSALGYSLISNSLPVTPHGGSWAVWLGGANNETARLTQSSISLSGVRYLHFWYWIGSDDVCGYDYAYVKVNGNTVKTYQLCQASSTGGWVLQTLDLNAYAGTTITLQFEVTTDQTLNSNFFLDDVSIGAILAQAEDDVQWFSDMEALRRED